MRSSTSDIYEAAYLYSKGMKVWNIFGNDRKTWFVMVGPDELKFWRACYERKSARVNVWEFLEAIKLLLGILSPEERRTFKCRL